jgi:hypothetical protein
MKCCAECDYWTREMWPLWLGLAAALALLACAPRRVYLVLPCDRDNCGRLPDGF